MCKIILTAKPYRATLNCLLKKIGSGLLKNWQNFKLSQDHYRIMPTLYWFMSIVNANFSVNPMSPIINFWRWKLVKHLNCFGDNRRTKDARKIICSAVLKHVVWLYSDTAFLITFLHEKVGMKSLKRILRNLDGQNKQGAPKGKHVRNWKKAKNLRKAIFLSPVKFAEWAVICR